MRNYYFLADMRNSEDFIIHLIQQFSMALAQIMLLARSKKIIEAEQQLEQAIAHYSGVSYQLITLLDNASTKNLIEKAGNGNPEIYKNLARAFRLKARLLKKKGNPLEAKKFLAKASFFKNCEKNNS